MANEIVVNATLAYSDSEDTDVSLQLVDKTVTVTTKIVSRLKQNIGITEEALKLGEISSVGWCLIINRDASNFVNIKVGTAGAIFAKLFPGECCMLRLGSGAQAPYAIADTAPCQIDLLLCSV